MGYAPDLKNYMWYIIFLKNLSPTFLYTMNIGIFVPSLLGKKTCFCSNLLPSKSFTEICRNIYNTKKLE